VLSRALVTDWREVSLTQESNLHQNESKLLYVNAKSTSAKPHSQNLAEAKVYLRR